MAGRCRRILACLAVVAAWPLVAAGDAAHAADGLGRFVDPFVGTDEGAQDFGTGGGAGNTFPGAVVPFGMVQFSPDTDPGTTAFGGGYSHDDTEIRSFSLKHLSGPGCAAYQDFGFTPRTAPPTSSPAQTGSIELSPSTFANFDHGAEAASPGRYRVALDPGTPERIDSDLTATTRTAVGRFGFPADSTPTMLVNATSSTMGTREGTIAIDPAAREMSGSALTGSFCYRRNSYRIFFVARFSRPFAAHGTWRRSLLFPGSTENSDVYAGDPLTFKPVPGAPREPTNTGASAQTGGYVTFADRDVEVRVGVSFVSAENARRNLDAESAGETFATVERRATDAWEDMLGRARVEGGRPEDLRRYYTALYHSFIHPSTFSDVNGEYRGFDDRVHRAEGFVKYADYSGWDTYRSQMPLVAMLAPGRASDMARSLLADARDGGFLPRWPVANGETGVMTGDPAAPILASAWALGARDFDAEEAQRAMVRNATQYGVFANGLVPPRPSLNEYLALGYVPHEKNTDLVGATVQPELTWGSAATTLEYAVADFAIARFAAAARCDRATYAEFMRRSANWRNVFNPAARHAQPRFASGVFREQDPADGEGWVEGNSAQYTLFVPQDPAGLFEALGGRDAAAQRLETFFSELNAGAAKPFAFLGNEPSLGHPWLLHWIGRPHRSQEVVRRALLELYSDTPGGFPGNDDLGSMSSWWVLGALGLYPAVPGTDVLAVGSPLFERATLRLRGGTVEIHAPAAARGRPFVQRLRIDGLDHARPWLRLDELGGGARLDFAVADRPHPTWGRAAGLAPPSYGPDDPMVCNAGGVHVARRGALLPSSRRCTSRRRFTIRLRQPRGRRLRSARVLVDGRRTRVFRRRGRLYARIDLRGRRRGTYRVRVTAVTTRGTRITSTRRYRTCRPRAGSPRRPRG